MAQDRLTANRRKFVKSFLRSGAVAGAVSAAAFALVHGLFISEIWFSLPMLLAAGALCGLCLGWTFWFLFYKPSLGSWFRYNALFVGLLASIALVSELVYEPAITIDEVMTGPPPQLYLKAMPVTILTTLIISVIVFKLYGRTPGQFASVLITSSVLVLFLGLNVSLMGLVFVPTESLYLVAENFGLIFALGMVNFVVFAGLEWKGLNRKPAQDTS
jgi:hypothetical protein